MAGSHEVRGSIPLGSTINNQLDLQSWRSNFITHMAALRQTLLLGHIDSMQASSILNRCNKLICPYNCIIDIG